MICQLLVTSALYLDDLCWLLDFKDFTDGGWYRVLFQVILGLVSCDDLNGILEDTHIKLIDFDVTIDHNLDAKSNTSIIVGGLGTLTTFEALVHDSLVAVQVMNSTEALQIDVDKERLVRNIVFMARFELGICFLNKVWPHRSAYTLTHLHRLQDALDDWTDHFSIIHQMLSCIDFLEYSLGAVSGSLEDFHVQEELIVLRWSIVTYTWLFDSFYQTTLAK